MAELTPDQIVIGDGLAQIHAARGKRDVLTDGYAGNHDLSFASEGLRRDAVGRALNRYSSNIIKPIVKARLKRLSITGLSVVKSRPSTKKVLERFEELSQEVAFEEFERELFREALVTGDAYGLTWLQPGAAYPDIVVYGADQAAIGVDPARPTITKWLVLTWKQGKRIRLDLYTPAGVFPYITRSDTRSLPRDPRTFVPLLDENGNHAVQDNPWGEVPVVHLRADSIVEDLLDDQRGCNKAIVDLLISLEYFSKPLRYATKMGATSDKVGNPKPGAVLKLPEGAELKQLPAEDLTKIVTVVKFFRELAAENSGTPKRSLGLTSQGVPPSGEMIIQEYAELSAELRGYQSTFGPRLERFVSLMLRMVGVDARVKLQWADPVPLSDMERVALVREKQAAGWSRKRALLEYGMTEEDYDHMAEELAEERAEARDAQVDAFSRGVVVDTPDLVA